MINILTMGEVKFAGLKVGDEVAIHWHREVTIEKVTKVGRKWFEVKRCKFALEDGSTGSGYSHPQAYTMVDHERSLAIKAATEALKAFGIEFDYHTQRDKILLVYKCLKEAGHLS